MVTQKRWATAATMVSAVVWPRCRQRKRLLRRTRGLVLNLSVTFCVAERRLNAVNGRVWNLAMEALSSAPRDLKMIAMEMLVMINKPTLSLTFACTVNALEIRWLQAPKSPIARMQNLIRV